MQALVISERTLEPLFLLSFLLLLFVFVYLFFFLVVFLKLIPCRSLVLSADLISPPLHFLYGRSPVLSSKHCRVPTHSSQTPVPRGEPLVLLQRLPALALFPILLPMILSIQPSQSKAQRLGPTSS